MTMFCDAVTEAVPADRGELEAALTARLLAAGRLDPSAADRARRIADESGRPLEAALAHLGLVGEREIAETVGVILGLPFVAPEDFPEAAVLDEAVSPRFLREARVLPLARTGDRVALAMADPLDGYTVQAIEMSLGVAVERMVAAPSDIEAAFERAPGARAALTEIADEIGEASDDGLSEDIDRLRDLASEAPVIRLVNLLITRAIESRASDVHIEPFGTRLLVRYRVDGVMREGAVPPQRLQAAVISRVKIMARMNIAERRLPQDGRIRFTFRGREYDLRVSTMPTLHGEAVVMRILDRHGLVPEFASLGFQSDVEAAFLAALRRPQGIVLVTGPTGSGKTTTLYTALMQLNDPGKKLFTIEDPIEYELDGVNQVQVKSKIGLGFAQILRAVLRHDPDIAMIGEIRDLETAEVAIRAALTGHGVLSTLHTNDAGSAVTRLLDMGVEGYLVSSTVTAVLAQRLVRKLCTECRAAHDPTPELIAAAGGEGGTFFRPVGCDACQGSGFHGRLAITELLVMTPELARLATERRDAGDVQRAAVAGGMRTMYIDGMAKARAGLTTIDEVLRVTRES